jgi:hypothetical protein
MIMVQESPFSIMVVARQKIRAASAGDFALIGSLESPPSI